MKSRSQERFDSYEAAKLRIAQIEYERSLGVFEPQNKTIIAPKKDHYVTVGELLDEYVQLYGLKHWGDSYLSSSQHFIAHYIKPAIGDVFGQRRDHARSGRLFMTNCWINRLSYSRGIGKRIRKSHRLLSSKFTH